MGPREAVNVTCVLAEAHEARVVTSAVRGVFRDQPATRQEFLDVVTAPQANLLQELFDVCPSFATAALMISLP
jgi:hypothetical protein